MSHKDTFPFGQKFAWNPNEKWIAESNLQHFMHIHHIKDIDTLQQKSITDAEWFWEAVLQDLDIRFQKPYDTILDTSGGFQFPKWCVGGQMNIVHNCLDKRSESSHLALRWEGEEGSSLEISYADLNREVCRCSNALHELGFKKGDVIGLYMPMIPELLIAFLAIAKIGAIILPLFSGYGIGAVETRLADSDAVALFTVDGAFRRGKTVPMKETANQAVRNLNNFKHIIVVRRCAAEKIPMTGGRDYWWHDLIDRQADTAPTEQTNAEDAVMLIYTSGTTGKPKGAIHSHCGFPVKAAQDMYHCMDLKPENIMYWMSDMGWMMGPWEVFGTLLIGATMLFYDGAPDFPGIARLWQQIETHKITHLGVSPTLIRTLKSHGTGPIHQHDVSSLRMIGSTGSPWDPESWMWLFENVLEKRKPILNYSGGTEISGGIVCGNFFKALKPCAFSGPVPGMNADVVDENGHPLRGEVGELVIRSPWIGMTRGFWKDRDRYVQTYWSRWPDTWVHGDFAAIDEDNLWYILGRSDDTIKVGGKRLGPAEVEAILNSHENVAESAVIGVPDDIKGEEVVCFCVLQPDQQPTPMLRNELSIMVVAYLGKPLKPREINFVTKLPKTRNAKVMHRVIRATYLRKDPGDLSSLEDPSAVEAIRSAE
jgi:acetyl-CoA synthetase